MTGQDRNKRRALIVRRETARRVSLAQREIWRRRRAEDAGEFDDGAGGADHLLADLPEGLV